MGCSNFSIKASYHLSAILMGVVRQDVKRSAGSSGFIGRISDPPHAANWIQFLTEVVGAIWATLGDRREVVIRETWQREYKKTWKYYTNKSERSWTACTWHQLSTVAFNNPPGHTFELPSETWMSGLADCCKPLCNYPQISNISCALTGNKIVDNSDVVGASPVGTAPTTSSFST